jgi:type VI secretion system secreted protein Hcp
MKGLLRVATGSALCLMLAGTLAYGAQNYYLKIEGVKQGAFKGEASRKGSLWIPVLQVSQGIESPRDAATGLASGKRQHKSIVIRKQVDAASPQLYRAATSHELLKQVVIEFVRPDAQGKEESYQTITLTDGNLAGYKRIGPAGKSARGKQEKEEEEISITYEKIEVKDKLGKTAATDDWAPR